MLKSVCLALPLLLLACVTASSAFAGSPVEGFWRTQTGGAVIEVHACGDAVCGRVVDSTDLRQHPGLTDDSNKDASLRGRQIRGLDILQDFKGGPTDWKDGQIYDPNHGTTYRAKLKLLNASSMRVTGCIVFPLCGSQVWRRAR